MPTTVTSIEDDVPSLKDLEEGHWSALAQKHWAKPIKTRKIRAEIIQTEIWEVLEREDFQFRSLLVLESLQLLEKYVFVCRNNTLLMFF